MSHQPEDASLSSWHKYFAIECNNRAWDLTVKERSPAEHAEMLDTAHAAAFHWAVVGNELNTMRATMLLAEVHALHGNGKAASGYAQTMRNFFVQQNDTPDWELAFVHVITAHAAAVAEDKAEHTASYAKAVDAIEAIVDIEDRKVVEATFKHVAKP